MKDETRAARTGPRLVELTQRLNYSLFVPYHQSREGSLRKLLVLVAAAAVSAASLASSASANHSWGGYHWARTANPFTISVGDNVSSAWDSYLQTAASDWSANTSGNPLNASVTAGSSRGKCKPTTGRVEVCDDAYGNNGWLGQAQIWLARGSLHITQGTAKMNDTYYAPGMKYDTAAWRGAVMCQEVGHTFGLDHQDESGADFHTCMDYASNPDADNMHPNTHDYDELAIIYSHLDSSTTIASTTASTDATRGAAPVSVSRSDRIKDSVIVERFADGSARVTHITWAIG